MAQREEYVSAPALSHPPISKTGIVFPLEALKLTYSLVVAINRLVVCVTEEFGSLSYFLNIRYKLVMVLYLDCWEKASLVYVLVSMRQSPTKKLFPDQFCG